MCAVTKDVATTAVGAKRRGRKKKILTRPDGGSGVCFDTLCRDFMQKKNPNCAVDREMSSVDAIDY